MNGRRADRKLHLELLRARAAANRIELSLAMHDISQRLDPLRRAADSIGSLAGVIGSRRRALRWLAVAAAALAPARWLRQVVAGAAARLHSSAAPRSRAFALAALAAVAVVLLIRRGRGSPAQDAASRGEETG
jgi:hypothetical protein